MSNGIDGITEIEPLTGTEAREAVCARYDLQAEQVTVLPEDVLRIEHTHPESPMRVVCDQAGEVRRHRKYWEVEGAEKFVVQIGTSTPAGREETHEFIARIWMSENCVPQEVITHDDHLWFDRWREQIASRIRNVFR